MHKTVKNCLILAGEKLGAEDISFPAISTGIFGFPVKLCAEIFFKATIEYLENYPNSTLETIRIILHEEQNVKILQVQIQQDLGCHVLGYHVDREANNADLTEAEVVC